MAITKLGGLAAAATLVLALGACGGDPTEGDDSPKGTITVGYAGFPESQIIAEIYAQGLEAEGVDVEVRSSPVGEREAYIPALENGEIDLVPEYSGNLLGYFDPEATATSSEEVDDALDEALPEKLDVLEASAAEDKDSLNVTREFSEKNGVTSIADLAKVDGLKLGAAPVFKDRPYGPTGLEKVYGVKDIEFVPIADGGGPNTVKALLDGTVDVADIYTTTPSITENDLVTLEDPENLIAAQNVLPLINEAKATDKVEDVLDAISAKLTTEDLVALNAENQGANKTSAADVAKKWLTDQGLI
jgi:osmoprotectant transport system substrate-binding protein